LRPGGGYFGTKKANEQLHVQYSYDDQSVVVVNSYYRPFAGHKVTAKVYNLDLTEKFSKTAPVDIAPDSVTQALVIPKIDGLSDVYFVKLSLEGEAGKLVSSNFYWLSTKPDVSDWGKSEWYYTPISSYADLTGLETLPEAKVSAALRAGESGTEEVDHIAVSNPGSHLALSVHLTVLKGRNGPDLEPVLWQDNYFELMPGEQREITATYKKKLLGGTKPYIKVDGWNIAPMVP
jgi:exo-1,4-beta-D-glucosaminidase